MKNRYFLQLDVVLLAPLPFLVVALRFESTSWHPDTLRAVLAYGTLAFPIRFGGAVLIETLGFAPVRMLFLSLLWDALLSANLLIAPRLAAPAR